MTAGDSLRPVAVWYQDKSQIRCKEISYVGHIIGKDGLKPDPRKVEAIIKMDPPKDKEELQRFLSMTTYVAKSIPNYSKVAAPLRILLEKSSEWHWSHQQETSFQELVTHFPVLTEVL